MTRQQRYLREALENVQALARQTATKELEETRRVYGGLCHTLPILLLTNGLSQTLAYIEDKKRGDSRRAAAYQTIRSHIAATLGLAEEQLLTHVQAAPLDEYLRDTRTLLDAWVYYKRFAGSILGVESGEGSE